MIIRQILIAFKVIAWDVVQVLLWYLTKLHHVMKFIHSCPSVKIT